MHFLFVTGLSSSCFCSICSSNVICLVLFYEGTRKKYHSCKYVRAGSCAFLTVFVLGGFILSVLDCFIRSLIEAHDSSTSLVTPSWDFQSFDEETRIMAHQWWSRCYFLVPPFGCNNFAPLVMSSWLQWTCFVFQGIKGGVLTMFLAQSFSASIPWFWISRLWWDGSW